MTATMPTSGALRLARPVAMALIALILGTHIAGVVVWAQTLRQVCWEQETVCQQTRGWLMPEDAIALQASGLSLSTYANLEVLKILIFSGIWMSVGGLILIRKSNEWMALVAAFMLITFPTQWDFIRDTLVRVYPTMVWPVHFFGFFVNASLPLFLALFPNGRWSPSWMRWVVLAFMVIGPALQIFPSDNQTITGTFQPLQTFSLFGLLFLAQVIRYYRVSTPIERMQARWVVTGTGAGLAIVIGMFVVAATNILPSAPGPFDDLVYEMIYQTAAVLIPLSIAVSILHYRLFEIDVLIRRTLQYSLLSGLLALVYFGLIVILQSLFTTVSGQSSSVAVVASTLAIAALFLPLRRRVQDFIDKRFFRQKYDAQKVLAEFAATARDETDLDNLTTRLVDVVQATMQPESITLWLKPEGQSRQSIQDQGPPHL